MLYELPCRLVTTRTEDGISLHGAHFAPQDEHRGKAAAFDAALLVHGAAANFYSVSFYQQVAPLLIDLGLDVFCVNNRGHDLAYGTSQGGRFTWQGAAFEHVGSASKDIAAWLDLIHRKGLHRILIVGHSLGAIKVLLSQSLDADENVCGIVACSPPRLSYKEFMSGEDRDRFITSFEIAKDKIDQGKADEIIQVTFPFPLLISAMNYLDKYGPEENYNILRFTSRISLPTLLLFGERELKTNQSFRGLDQQLVELTRDCRNFSHAIVADADHFYTGAEERLLAVLRDWIENSNG